MRTMLLSLAVATAFGTASVANAASFVVGVTPALLTPPASGLFGAVVTGSAGSPTAINDSFSFTIGGTAAASLDSQVSSILLNGTQDIDFSSVTLDSTYSFVQTSWDDHPETFALLNPVTLAPGAHTITVVGTLNGVTGAYSGTINVQVAVPEPATWGLMILGLGGIGLAVRRTRRRALAQIA